MSKCPYYPRKFLSNANDILHRFRKKITKLIWGHKRSEITKTSSARTKLEAFITSNFNIHYIALIAKAIRVLK